jgi:hypothetical protein
MVVVVEGAEMVVVVEAVPAPLAEVEVVVSRVRRTALESPSVRTAMKIKPATERTARATRNLRMPGLLLAGPSGIAHGSPECLDGEVRK